MYCRPKVLGLNITLRFVAIYATTKAIHIINIHCFWAVVEIPCSEKSAKSETSNFGLHFLTFLKCRFKRNVKSCVFFGFSKNVKYVFSNYDVYRLSLYCFHPLLTTVSWWQGSHNCYEVLDSFALLFSAWNVMELFLVVGASEIGVGMPLKVFEFNIMQKASVKSLLNVYVWITV